MKIKYLVAACLMTLSSFAFAKTSGFYVGAGAAGNFFNIDNKYSFDPDLVEDISMYDNSYHVTTRNTNPDVLVGYGKYVCNSNLYLGLEFDTNFNNIARTRTDNVSTTNQFLFGDTYSLTARLGYEFFQRTTPYALFGISRTNVKRVNVFSPTGNYAAIGLAPLNKTNAVWGQVGGVGIDFAFTEHWHVAAEYNHIFSNSTNFQLQQLIFKFMGTLSNNKVSFTQDVALLKVIYAI
jgi:opacity protein-like surface antigen